MLFLTLALCSSYPHTTRFLRDLETAENPSYINIIKSDLPWCFADLLNVFGQPKIIFNTTSLDGFNYLNLPRYDKTWTLKLYFNNNFLSIILIDQISKSPLDLIEQIQQFSKLSTVVIISRSKDLKCLNRIMEILYKMHFINVIHLDIETFEENKTFTTFNSFPEYQLISKTKYEKQTVKDIMGKNVFIFFQYRIPYCFNDKQENNLAGFSSHFFINFVKFVNGTLNYKLAELQFMHNLDTIFRNSSNTSVLHTNDFLSSVPLVPQVTYKEFYPFTSEMQSNYLDYSKFVILIPRSKSTEKKLYLLRIFSFGIWSSTLTFVIFASFVLSMHNVIRNKKANFWRAIGQFLRSCLGQAFPGGTTVNFNSHLYFVSIWFGFVLTAWFSSILGSFTTTMLTEKQPRSLEDMRMQHIKLAVRYPLKESNYTKMFIKFEEAKDVIVFVNESEIISLAIHPKEYAISVNSVVWYYFMVPLMEFYRNKYYIKGDFIMEDSFLRVIYRNDSIYKEQINRFIGLTRESGLYQHWCDIVHLEAMQMNLNPYDYHQENNVIGALGLDFFTYPYCIWTAGLICSSIIFLLEIIIHKSYKFYHY